MRKGDRGVACMNIGLFQSSRIPFKAVALVCLLCYNVLIPHQVTMSIFSSPKAKRTSWPTELNPCPTPMTTDHCNSCYWNVLGHVTELCNGCVWDKERETGDRKEALDTFVSDASGVLCKPYWFWVFIDIINLNTSSSHPEEGEYGGKTKYSAHTYAHLLFSFTTSWNLLFQLGYGSSGHAWEWLSCGIRSYS